ncbi:hypothetical protein T09_13662, partial [Trichinella sp. T9]
MKLLHSLVTIRNFTKIRNHVITKHYYQLIPLSLATVKPQALPSGYAPGQIKICIFPQAILQAIYSTIFDLRVFLCKFLIASGPRRRLRLCPRATPRASPQ